MRVQLVRKFAEIIDGIDLSAHREGDVLRLPRREAQLLIAEGWGVAVRRAARQPAPAVAAPAVPLDPDDNLARLHQLRGVHVHDSEPRVFRRIEDWLREEIHDARAQTVLRSPTGNDEVPS